MDPIGRAMLERFGGGSEFEAAQFDRDRLCLAPVGRLRGAGRGAERGDEKSRDQDGNHGAAHLLLLLKVIGCRLRSNRASRWSGDFPPSPSRAWFRPSAVRFMACDDACPPRAEPMGKVPGTPILNFFRPLRNPCVGREGLTLGGNSAVNRTSARIWLMVRVRVIPLRVAGHQGRCHRHGDRS